MKIVRKSDGAVYKPGEDGISSDKNDSGWDEQSNTFYGNNGLRIVKVGTKGSGKQKTTGGATPSVEELYAQDYAKAQKKQREAGDIMAFGAGGGNMNNSHFGNFFSAGVTGSAAGYANAVGTAAAAVGENDRKEVERWQRSLAAAKDALEKAETPADRTKAQAWADEAEKNLAAMQKQQAEVTKAEKAAEKVEKGAYWAADKLQEKSQEYTDRGNEGLGKVGRVLGSAVVSGTQMLGDAGLNALIPGSGLAAMGVRAFGGSAQEARKDGASYEQQLMYGGANAAVEVLSEKMFNGLSGLYGKGFMDESKLAKGVSKAFARMDNTAAGRTAKAVLGNMGEEAMEEVVAGVIEPAFGSLYNGKKIRENYDSDTVADIVEAAVVGGLLGGLGGSAEIANNAYETKAYQGVYGTDTEALVKEALDINPENKTAMKAQEKLKKGKQLSAAEIRRLVQENEQAMQQGAENTQGAMEQQETEQQEEQIAENTPAMAQNAAPAGQEQTVQNPERMRRGIAYQEENAQEEPLKAEMRQPTVEELYTQDYEAARERMEAPQREAEAQEMEDYAAAYPGVEETFKRSKPADLSAREWNAAWNVAYQMGASTTEEAAESNLQKVQGRLQGIVRPEIAEVAFHAGRESERSMNNEEIIGDQSGIRDGGQWAGGQNSAEQIREVEEDTGRAAEKAAERGAERLTGRAVRRGDMPESVQVKRGTQMVEGEKTESMKRGEAIAQKNGLTVRWFRGDNIILPGGGEANGCYDGKEVWARADDPRFTAEQIVQHEVTHDEIQRGLVDTEKVWAEMERKYGEDRMAGYLEMYREAFMGADFTDEEVMEEIICDAEGGMNKFAGVLEGVAGEYGEVLEAAKQETEQSRKTQRGPPESAKNTATEDGVKGSAVARANDYTYETLVKKPDMPLTMINDGVAYKPDKASRSFVVETALRRAERTGKKNENGNVVVHVKDTDTEVILSKAGLRHGLDRRFSVNAPVTIQAGEILKNAVKINEMVPENENIEASYALIGVAKNKNNEPYIVQFVVNRASNEVTSVDVLYAMNAKTEPAGSLSPKIAGKVPATLTGSKISISDLLEYVNVYYPDILPESVLRHYGHDRRPEGKLGKTALFSSTGTEKVKALVDQNMLLQKRVQALNRQKESLQKQVNRYRDKATFSPERVGREIIKAYSGTVKEAEIHEEVRQLIDYAARKDGISYGRLKEMAVGVAGKIVRSAESVANSEVQREYRDIREYHKQVKIRVSEQVKRDFWDWNGWQKLNGRKLNVRNGEGVPIDVAYAEMQERFGTAYYPENIVNPADQLRHMSEVMESLAPVMENPYSYNMAVATESCANELADMVMREVAKGYAGTISYQRNENLYNAEKTAREQARKAVEAERERWEKQVEDLKLGWRVTEESRRERQADSEARDKLFRMVKRLNNRKLPAATKALLNKYIGDLDTISRGMTGQTINDLSALKQWYEVQSRNPDFIPDERTKRALERLEKRQVSDLTSKEVAELTQVLQNIEHQIRTEKQFIESQEKRDTHAAGVRAMEDVENSEGGNFTVWEKKFVNETLTPMRQFRRITGYAQNDPLVTMLREMEAGQRKKIDYAMTNKERFQRWTDDKKLMQRLFGKDADEIEIAGIAKADAKKMAETEGTGEWEKSITRVKITPAMRMSLFLHSLSNDNLRHIAGGGITVPDMKLYKQGKIAEAYSRGTTITLTPSQVRAITARMTPAERAFAFAARDYFNEVSKEAINETSEKLVGYSIAGVDNYYPITTDPNFSKKELDALKYDGTIEGMGFLKERIESKSPMMLQDMNQVLMRSIDNHAKYVGMAIPVRNMSKLLNITEKSFDAAGNPVGAPGSLMATISQKWGGEGLKYVTKVLADEQGGYKETDTWGETLAKLSSNYAGAVLNLNAGTAIKQAASYPTAAAVVGWQPLLKAMRRPGGINTNLIRAYTPLLAYRAEGFSTPEQGGLKEQGKQMPKALNWIQAMDVGTTTLLWRAAEIYVEDNFNLEKGQNIMEGKSPFYQKVAEVYNRIIEETQPNYTTLQRSQLQRSNNQTSKLLNMFKTQPFQNFNILYDAVGDFKAQRRAFTNEGTPEAKARMEEAGKRLKNAVTSQMVAAFVFSMMQWAWDSLRRKDDKYRDKDGEETLLSWMKGMGMNMVSNSVGMIPFGTELWTLFGKSVDTVIKEAGGKPFFGENWYGFEMSVLDTLTDVGSGAIKEVGAVVKVVRQMVNADEETDWESFARETYAAAEDVSVAMGIPVGNAKKMLTAAAQWTMVLTHGKWVGNYYALRIEQDPADSRAAFYDLLYRAYKSGDSKQYKELYDIMADNDDFSTSSQTPEEAIKSAMESRMKKAEGVSSVKELKQRYKAP